VDIEAEGAHVLCHGDFTPSQILLVGQRVSGIVDVDTACWGESAMDLGRFLAHLDLLIAKERGQSAEPLRAELGHSFLAGYGDVVGAAATDQHLHRRVARYRWASLALTALHACRQLKQPRMNLALSLLDTAVNRMERTTS
jgi:aminoglycoside phosphotransferase (APT) family kinase protein